MNYQALIEFQIECLDKYIERKVSSDEKLKGLARKRILDEEGNALLINMPKYYKILCFTCGMIRPLYASRLPEKSNPSIGRLKEILETASATRSFLPRSINLSSTIFAYLNPFEFRCYTNTAKVILFKTRGSLKFPYKTSMQITEGKDEIFLSDPVEKDMHLLIEEIAYSFYTRIKLDELNREQEVQGIQNISTIKEKDYIPVEKGLDIEEPIKSIIEKA